MSFKPPTGEMQQQSGLRVNTAESYDGRSNVWAVESERDKYIHAGLAFVSSHRIANVAASSTVYLQFKTPADSVGRIHMKSRHLTAVSLSVAKSVRVRAALYEGSSETAGGTDIPIANLERASTNVSGATNKYHGTTAPVTLGDALPLTSTAAADSGLAETGGSDIEYVMAPATVYTLAVSNEVSDANAQVDLDWAFYLVPAAG